MSDRAFHRSQAELLPARPAPVAATGAIGWIRQNLFSSWLNAILTLVSVYLLWLIVPGLLDWAFFSADYTGDSGADCTGHGACWAWFDQRIDQFLYGFYPAESYWRVNLTFVLLFPALAYVLFEGLPFARYGRIYALAFPVIAAFLLVGGFVLETVPTKSFGASC